MAVVGALGLAAGCKDHHPSRAEAAAACEHQVELGFWNGFERSIKAKGLDPNAAELKAEGERGLAEQRATPEWKAAVDKCTDGFVRLGTREQMKCVGAATSTEAAAACLK